MNNSIIQRPFRYQYSNWCLYIIIINVAVFLATYLHRDYLTYLSMNPLNVIHRHMYWQFVTYMFAHANVNHLFFNMLGLFFFGTMVERSMGSKEFLLFYMTCGILAGIFSFVVYESTGYYRVFLLGASGALFAVMLAYAIIYPDSTVYLMGIVPLKAPVLVLGYTAIEIFSQITGYQSGVAHLTHLGGFAFAFLYFVVRFRINPVDRLFGRR